ncbi:thiamine diphosphokinase [Atopobacter phocae]|uniref:thiamine diphosphokinase n=1 Tax=Atopobacter phocae TaxID=136492 RepID=UPI00046EDBAD|nr:thiamine diphosphokinase [Atopobacter phocae]
MIHIYIGGDLVDSKLISISPNDTVIGVDRGSLRWLDLNIQPTICIGDFDSISDSEYEKLSQQSTIIKLPAEKDLTDTETALKYVIDEQLQGDIYIYGFTGGRLDHLMSCLWFGYHPMLLDIIERLHFVSNNNRMHFIKPGTHTIDDELGFKYLSFVTYTSVKNLTLSGVKYPLLNSCIKHPLALISNEFISETAIVQFDEGLIAVIVARD